MVNHLRTGAAVPASVERRRFPRWLPAFIALVAMVLVAPQSASGQDAPPPADAAEAPANEAFEDPAKELVRARAALAEVRARLLSEDPEAAKIHEKILRLYSELDRVLADHPKVQELRAEINRLSGEEPPPAPVPLDNEETATP